VILAIFHFKSEREKMKDLMLIEGQEIEFLTRINLYEKFAQDHLIHSVETYSQADQKITEGEHIKKAVKEKLDPIVSSRHKAHKEATKFRSGMIDPVELGSQVLMAKMRVFQKAQDEKYAEEKRKLEAEAKEKQESECLKQAEEMEKAGESKDVIDAVLELAEDPLPEVCIATPILRSKTSFTIGWDVEVVNENEVPEQYIIRTVNVAAIQKIVNDKKGNIKIPGIKIEETKKARRNSR
jgi:hypothetical protein